MTKNILQNFGVNFIKGGLTIGIALLLIDILSKYQNMIYVYGFISASFFLIQLFQFNRVYRIKPALTSGFIKHTLIGWGLFLICTIVMYVMYDKNYSTRVITFTCASLWVLGIIIYLCIIFIICVNIY